MIGILYPSIASAQNVITTFAGTEWLFPGDGRPDVDAPLAGILGMAGAGDRRGNVFVADADNLMVFKVGPDGILHILAGNGINGYSGDGGAAVNAAVFLPTGVALDTDENVYIAEYSNRIRMSLPRVSFLPSPVRTCKASPGMAVRPSRRGLIRRTA